MKIIKVYSNSLAKKIGLLPGDRLLKINGKKVLDEIDYKFRITEENLTLDLEINGKLDRVEVDKEYDEGLGVEFEEMKIRKCANDCVFCFVDQNPIGMRDGMYFRDGDYRMSYLHGHYITMTNMGKNELNRIVEQKMSPLYISVHVTDQKLREKLFLYIKDDNLLEKIKYLTDNGIELHTQIVLMPTINDKDFLIQTLLDLYLFSPKLRTCTIVPVGLTKHRKGLMDIPKVNEKYAIKFLKNLPKLRKIFPGEKSPFLLCSDEWYILAKNDLPLIEDYGNVDLVENGVGQVQTFLNRFHNHSKDFPKSIPKSKKITLVTGSLIHDIMNSEVVPVLKKIKNLHLTLIPIKNNFYGESVSVSGLLTGADIIHQLTDEDLGDEIWISHRILNDDRSYTLDNMTLEDISEKLNCLVRVGEDSFKELIEGIMYG